MVGFYSQLVAIKNARINEEGSYKQMKEGMVLSNACLIDDIACRPDLTFFASKNINGPHVYHG